MAGPARYTALLDACVLFPPRVADALMSLHVAGLYTARWTSRIEQEWVTAVLRKHSDIEKKLNHRREAMRAAVVDWEVDAASYEALMPCLELPDPNDTHVLAAAIAGHVDCIVTTNMKHFPQDVMNRHGLEAIHPDDFILRQIDLDVIAALAAFKDMRRRFRRPPLEVEQFAQSLERCALAGVAQRLREAAELI